METENAEKENKVVILFEDEHMLVINKPYGMMVHADGHYTGTTVVDWFVQYVPSAKGVGEEQTLKDGTPIDRSGIVHRLDRDTSGVMILAKTGPAFVHLKAQFHDRLVVKEYRAFVYGAMREQWGTINRPIGRNAKDYRLRSAQKGAKGMLRDSVTDWETIGQNARYSYLRIVPKTGRTHQIRVHLKSIDRPIVGDTLYAPKNFLELDDLGIGRLALHAHKLSLILPSGEEGRFIAPVPQSFEDAAERIIE